MRCTLRQGQRLRTADQRLNRYTVNGTAFGFDRICIPAVEREAHLQFARSDELRDEDVALAHLRLEPCKPLKEFPATLLAHRAEVAKALNLDEGTVSRATANKYALLPNGRLIPLSDFFDSSLSVKDILKELIATEDPRKRLSDDELAKLMQARGIPMARRTVTKYREEIGIGSSRERR